MNPPSWLNKTLFQTSLRKYFKNNLEILEVSCKSAIPAGENYTTDVFRVNITFIRGKESKDEEENLSLIIKCTREGIVESLATDMNLFPKEIDMFCNVLPNMNCIYGVDRAFSANCINTSLKPRPFVMVEDMCPLGFRVHERQHGLNLEHILIVLEAMAAFHATSFIMIYNNKTLIKDDMYTEGIFMNKEIIIEWIKNGFQTLKEAIENDKEFESYYKKLSKLSNKDIIDRTTMSWQRENENFSVLNHGDLWVNNIMFSYEPNGKPKGCKLLDFQLAVYTSPAIDLHYFLTTSMSHDIIQDRNYLLDFYYAQLLTSLTKLGYDLEMVPSRSEFKEDYRRRAFYGLTTIATVLPMVKAEGRSDANFEDLMTDNTKEGFRYHCYNNDNYKSTALQVLSHYNELGIFE